MRCVMASLIVFGLCAVGAGQALGQTPPPDQPDASPEASRFQTCLRDVDLEAERRGISKALLERSRTGLAPDPDVIAAVGGQAEFERTLWEYLDAAVPEARVGTGQARLAEWADVLAAIEARFGVDRHVLAAIWGIESSYGAVLDDLGVVRPVVRSLATLACGDTSRSTFWREQLLAAWEMLERGDVTPDRMTGSWAVLRPGRQTVVF